jgi:small subunit ribosomal protein S8
MDPIADMLSMIKNAGPVSRPLVTVSYSKLKHAILIQLLEAGYVASVVKKAREKKSDALEIGLMYTDGQPKVSDVKRISKPSRRVYIGYKDLRPVKNGHGLTILSTPKGIITSAKARKELVGGEVLFEIW